MDKFYILGIMVGVLIGAAIGAILYFMRHKNGVRTYDERQIAARGKAARFGFVTLLALNAVLVFFDSANLTAQQRVMLQLLAMIVSLLVFALTAIRNDAYISMTENPKQFAFSGSILAVSMGVIGLVNLTAEREPNIVMGALCLAISAMWVIILAAFAIHNRRKADEE